MAERVYSHGSGQLILDPEALHTGQCVVVSEPFRFFFARDGSKSAPADLTDRCGNGVPDFVAGQLDNLLHAFHVFLNEARLPDFRQQGEMAEAGVRFVDVALDNLPIQRGLASAKVQDTTPTYLQGSPWSGPSVALRLHRALPLTSLTPAHELFHIFQYAALPFRNMWFMEGLARHGQRWPDNKPLKQEILPSTREGLEATLRRWHEAEPFWNRLSALCMLGEPNGLAATRRSGEGRAASPSNPHLAGQSFLSVYFDELAGCVNGIRADMTSRSLGPGSSWGAGEAKSASNNRYLLRAIDRAAARLNSSPNAELQDFLSLLRNMEASFNGEMDAPAVQQLFSVLERHAWGDVYRTSQLSLRCDAFDPVTATLSLASLRIGAEVSSDELKAFAVVRGLVGDLVVTDCPDLTELFGFENLVAIEGNLTLERTGLIQLAGSFPRLLRVKGTLRIADNRHLVAMNDFHQIESIDAALQIEAAPVLESLSICERLVEIKKGIMSLVNCPQLHTVTGFGSLARAGDILIERLAIANIGFLSSLFARNPVYPGFIKVTTCRLGDINAMRTLRSIRSSLYLHGNALESVNALGQLESVGGSLSLGGNRISSLHGLERLKRIDGMLGLANNRLSNLNGLESLECVKTTRWNKIPRSIHLLGNPSLTDLRALANVVTADGHLVLHCDAAAQYSRWPSAKSKFYQNILDIHYAA